MRSSFLLLAILVAGCAAKNPVPANQPISGSDILSCGDDLIGEANPAGAIEVATLTSSSTQTSITGQIDWQAACPTDPPSSGQVEWVLDTMTIYRDDAGYPGEPIGSLDFQQQEVLSCSDSSAIGGLFVSQPFGPLDVVSLHDLCSEYQQSNPGGPLYVQVEVTGHSTTCSSAVAPLTFRTQAGVECK